MWLNFKKNIVFFLQTKAHIWESFIYYEGYHFESKHIQPIVKMWLLEPCVDGKEKKNFEQYINICEFSQPM
jgi:hypothetical protein